jgi:hypothetical protein
MSYSRIRFYHVIYTVPCLRTIDSGGNRCDNYYSIPQRLSTLIRWKVLDFTADEVLEVLSMIEALSTYKMLCGTRRSDNHVRSL